MRRLAVIVTVATALMVTVMLQGQGKIDPAIETAPAWEAAFNGRTRQKSPHSMWKTRW